MINSKWNAWEYLDFFIIVACSFICTANLMSFSLFDCLFVCFYFLFSFVSECVCVCVCFFFSAFLSHSLLNWRFTHSTLLHTYMRARMHARMQYFFFLDHNMLQLLLSLLVMRNNLLVIVIGTTTHWPLSKLHSKWSFRFRTQSFVILSILVSRTTFMDKIIHTHSCFFFFVSFRCLCVLLLLLLLLWLCECVNKYMLKWTLLVGDKELKVTFSRKSNSIFVSFTQQHSVTSSSSFSFFDLITLSGGSFFQLFIIDLFIFIYLLLLLISFLNFVRDQIQFCFRMLLLHIHTLI